MSRTGNAPWQIITDVTPGAQGANAQSVSVPVVREIPLIGLFLPEVGAG
jgi:hypothetical protein